MKGFSNSLNPTSMSSKPIKAFESANSDPRLSQRTPRKSCVSSTPALALQQTKPVEPRNSSLEQRLSEMMSPADHSRKRQREDFTTHSAKKFRGNTRTAEMVCIELNHWGIPKTESFRCFFEHEVVPSSVSSTLIESFYDDDCPTDDENIEAAKEMMKRRLEEAILSYVTN